MSIAATFTSILGSSRELLNCALLYPQDLNSPSQASWASVFSGLLGLSDSGSLYGAFAKAENLFSFLRIELLAFRRRVPRPPLGLTAMTPTELTRNLMFVPNHTRARHDEPYHVLLRDSDIESANISPVKAGKLWQSTYFQVYTVVQFAKLLFGHQYFGQVQVCIGTQYIGLTFAARRELRGLSDFFDGLEGSEDLTF